MNCNNQSLQLSNKNPDINLAVVLMGVDDLQLKQVSMPPPPLMNQVVVRIKAVGICGSDVHYWKHGSCGSFVMQSPMIIGHESAGIITKIGPGVTNVQVGDNVALEPGVPCRLCDLCRSGSYNLCPDIKFFATPPVDGSLAQFVTHAADYCFKLPKTMTLEEGALCEPLSVGLYACERAGVSLGSTVAIFGCGPIGLVTLLSAKAIGAHTIVMTDVDPIRVEFAKQLGASFAIDVSDMNIQQVQTHLLNFCGKSVDYSIDCCGFQSATHSALLCTKAGGCVCLVGMAQSVMTLPILSAAIREVDVRGVFRYRNTYPKCIAMMSSGIIDAKPLITHRFKLTDAVKAFTTAHTGCNNAVKVMFNL